MKWDELVRGILKDELPRVSKTGKFDRDKYVKFSNLKPINHKMVVYYLRRGTKFPNQRKACSAGILEEMVRSSDERYDIEDSTKTKSLF